MRLRPLGTLVVSAVAAAFVATHGTHLVDLGVARAGTAGTAGTAELLPNSLHESLEYLSDLVAPVSVKGSRPGRHLGFDTYAYPGDQVMWEWRHDEVPYEWVGYYLPSPCHEGKTWMGKRERLAKMGWGMAVIYVGQQTWDKTPTGFETRYKFVKQTRYVSKRVRVYRTVNGKRVARYVTRKVPVKRTVRVPVKVRVDPAKRDIHDCNAQLVGAPRGRMEAADAIRRTMAEGFPQGSVIFLDIEYMRRVPAKMRDYYRAWTEAVLKDGRYRPGFYAHNRNATVIYNDVKAVYTKAGRLEEPPFWIAGGDGFTPDAWPHEVGHSFAAMWQGTLDVVEKWRGHALALDVNVAAVRDPSHQFVVATD